jgi:hypothetical protein
MWQMKLADPAVAPHLSGKEFARLMSEELGEPALFGENIGVKEQMETQQVGMDQEANMQEELMIKGEMGL